MDSRFLAATFLLELAKMANYFDVDKLLHIPINFMVGELDSRWRKKAELFSSQIVSMGGDADLEFIPGGDHFSFQYVQAQRLMQKILRNC